MGTFLWPGSVFSDVRSEMLRFCCNVHVLGFHPYFRCCFPTPVRWCKAGKFINRSDLHSHLVWPVRRCVWFMSLLQIASAPSRVCEPRSAGSWTAARTAAASGFTRATPATALRDSPWTCPAWPASVGGRSPSRKKNIITAVPSLCFTPAPLSACRCERVLGAEQPDVAVQERKVRQHGGLLPLRVPAGLQCLRRTQLLREDGQTANIHTPSVRGGREQQGHKNHTHKLIILYLWGHPLSTVKWKNCRPQSNREHPAAQLTVGAQQEEHREQRPSFPLS